MSTERKDWQQEAYTLIVENDSVVNVMIIAPTNGGKTYILNQIKDNTEATVVDGLKNDSELIRTAASRSDTVLVDEAGGFSHYRELLDILDDYPDVQFVLATLPDVPSMQLIRSSFTTICPQNISENNR